MNLENKNLNHTLVVNHSQCLCHHPQQSKVRSWSPLLRGALKEIPKPGKEANKTAADQSQKINLLRKLGVPPTPFSSAMRDQ